MGHRVLRFAPNTKPPSELAKSRAVSRSPDCQRSSFVLGGTMGVPVGTSPLKPTYGLNGPPSIAFRPKYEAPVGVGEEQGCFPLAGLSKILVRARRDDGSTGWNFPTQANLRLEWATEYCVSPQIRSPRRSWRRAGLFPARRIVKDPRSCSEGRWEYRLELPHSSQLTA